MIKGLACILLLWWTCSFEICRATIIVDSVHVTPSTCPNNGTATIYAHSSRDSAVFLYNVTAGPVTYPQQNDSVFASLYPGNYTAWVHDINSYDSTKVTFTITGNYKEPIITAVGVAPFCAGGDDGKIIGTLTGGAGLSPFTWQITSPFSGTPQTNDTIKNLGAGNYTLKITDACNVVRTATTKIDSGGTGLAFFNEYRRGLLFASCEMVIITEVITLYKDKAYLPLKISNTTTSGNVINYVLPIVLDTSNNPAVYLVVDTVFGVNYGDYLKICITDTCNVTVCDPEQHLTGFYFSLDFIPTSGNCIYGFNGSPYLISSEVTSTWSPLTYILTNALTGAFVDSFVVIDSFRNLSYQVSNRFFPPQPASNYILTVHDQCGNISQQQVQWPLAPVPLFDVAPSAFSCLDSTSLIEMSQQGFGSGVTLKILSGPVLSRSTKPGFAYTDSLVYPMTLEISSANSSLFNLPGGTYLYNVSDSCGNTIMDSITITDVASLGWNFHIQNNCNSLVTLDISQVNQDANPLVTMENIATGQTVNLVYNYGSNSWEAQGLTPGEYFFEALYGLGGRVGDFSTYLPGNDFCWTFQDTIIIPAHNDSILKATEVATCNGTIYIHVEVDSNNGILPFQYEILNGPEVFALQDSGNFIVQAYGTYLIGVRDSCGNEDIRQVTIDTGRFEPVVKSGGWCEGSAVQLSDVVSPYFTYRWVKPDGSVFTGDTLSIYPFTPADTGVYYITKIIQINDCRDSAFGTYHLVFRDTFQQNFALCPGDTFHVGSYYHTEPGVYYDTLTGMDGCDSIEVSTFSFLSSVQAGIFPSTPVTCPIYPTMLVPASGGTVYSWSPGGNEVDTVVLNPAVPTTYTVIVNDGNLCPDTASIMVYPVVDSIIIITAAKTAFCFLDSGLICAPAGFASYTWNNGETAHCIEAKQAGNYSLSVINNNGCQINSNHMAIAVYPTPRASIFPAIPAACPIYPTMLIATGGTIYSWTPGGYQTDTVLLNPNGPTNYTVTVSDSNRCTDTTSAMVYPIVDSIIQISASKTTFCYLDSALICAPTGFATYTWNDDETERCMRVKQSGNYYLSVTDINGCQINSNHLAITVYPAPPVEITISGDTLRVFNALSCQWYLNGSALASATDSVYIAHQPGTYTVFITDSMGCSIMSNGQVITGLNQLHDNISLHIYPDPASDELNIAYTLQLAAGVQITVTDLSGRFIQEVLNDKAEGGTYLKQVNIRSLAAGVYVLSFISGGNRIEQRFVKE